MDVARGLPFAEKKFEGKAITFSNPLCGIVVEQRAGAQAKPFAMTSTDASGKPRVEEFDYFLEAEIAYARAWIEWVTVEIGLGFHPDTPARDYEPPLNEPLRRQYDAMIAWSHEMLELGKTDPYEVGLAAMEAAGMIEAQPDGLAV